MASIKLKNILEELCKGNLSVMDINAVQFIADKTMELYNYETYEGDYKEDLKNLILICNILYNRSAMELLPVEDGVYDIFMERYKEMDPNFQVGSYLVDFKNVVYKQTIADNGKTIIHPIIELPKRNLDEVSNDFREKLISFDRVDSLRYCDLFYPRVDMNATENISKRYHDTKHNHPDLVGTLDKCKFVLDKDAIESDVYDDPSCKILERDWFVKHIMQGIYPAERELNIILELKYDGVSVEADCTDEVVSARSRGDTGAGVAEDITPILRGYKFTRNEVLKDREVGVKFEAIMTKENLYNFSKAKEYKYANCRTAITGLFGSSDAYKYRDFITLIPLALDRNNVPEITNRLEEVELLNRVYKTKGEALRYCTIRGNYTTCLFLIKKYMQEVEAARDWLNFEIDGIVVTYADEDIRNKLGRENFINKYQMAVKFDPEKKDTTFLGYTYEVGQNGNICPMIHYSPVSFHGTIHDKSTGSSYKRFHDLNLKIGDKIYVTYRNDVMPYVTAMDCEYNRCNPNPIEQFPTECPVCGHKLVISPSGKSATCPNVDCNGRKLARMVNMLQKLSFKGFAEATIMQLNVYTLRDLFQLSEEYMANIIGKVNAYSLRNSIVNIMTTPIEEYKIIGALGFTNIAAKTWKIIFSVYTLRDMIALLEMDPNRFIKEISMINGIGTNKAATIVNEYPHFKDDILFIYDSFNIKNSKDNILDGKVIRFTGVRNKELEQQLQAMGHDADGNASVTKKTDILLVPYEGFSSTKVSSVKENTMVIPIQEFMANMDKYLL